MQGFQKRKSKEKILNADNENIKLLFLLGKKEEKNTLTSHCLGSENGSLKMER